MTAKQGSAKKRIVVRRKITKTTEYMPPKLPSSPVTYPKSYGRSKKGRHIIPRFVVTTLDFKRDTYVVVDMQTGNLARGTNANGYTHKQAVAKAKAIRANEGLWTLSDY